MKPVWTLLLCIGVVFGTTALASPWLYLGFHPILHYPFHRYVDRTLMVTALLSLLLFWRGFGIRTAAEIGWASEPKGLGFTHFGIGVGLGVGSAVLFLVSAILCGGRLWHLGIGIGTLAGIVIGALILAPLEELLFRGVMQTIFIRGCGTKIGIGVGSLLFALLHFVKVPPQFVPSPVTASSGWTAIGLSLAPLYEGGWLQIRFLLLIGVGLILGLAAWRMRRLWLAIGLHAGWIIGARIGNGVTQGVAGHWARDDFSANPLSFLCLAGVALIVSKWPRSTFPT